MLKQKRRAGGARPEATAEPQIQPLPHKYAIGDNVMCLANGTYTQARHPILVQFIESGECGVVVEVQNDGVVVQFQDPPRLVCMPSTRIDKLVKRGASNGQ
jgi:ribosomal protein L21E